jgi:hypothetical protein
MSLTKEQLEARKGKLTASRIAVLMNGDAEGIMRLYRELAEGLPEEDLSGVWAVQLGAVTEKLNLDWYERKNKTILSHRGVTVPHDDYSWAAATLDAWDENLTCPVECKHVGGREPVETIIDRYQPQFQWQMCVTNADQCALSVIMGANEPIVEYIDRDQAYIDEELRRGERFMMCVDMKMPPIAERPAPPPAPDPTKIIDMQGSNQWAVAADQWLISRPYAVIANDQEKILKAMVPADAKKVFGHGIRITRDRAGRLSLRVDE